MQPHFKIYFTKMCTTILSLHGFVHIALKVGRVYYYFSQIVLNYGRCASFGASS
jgi:hypothetical protein